MVSAFPSHTLLGQNQQSSREGGSMGLLLYPYSQGVVFVVLYSLFTICITRKSPCISVSWKICTEMRCSGLWEHCGRLSRADTGRISNIMSSLWGHLLRPVPTTLPSSSSLSPGRCPWRDKTTWGEIPTRRSQSRRDSWAPLQCLQQFRKRLLSS